MAGKMITQRVKLSLAAHALIVKAQREVGLMYFPDALGYLLEGLLVVIEQPYGFDSATKYANYLIRQGMGIKGVENVDNS